MKMTSENDSFRHQVEITLRFLFEFIKHPLQRITVLPDWGWSHLTLVLIGTSLVSGTLNGIVSLSFYQFAYGLFVLPTTCLITDFVLTSFMYYYFQVFERRVVSFRKLWTLVIFASIPFFLFQAIASLIPPITLIGLAFSGFLLVVGLSENFKLEKKRALRLIVLLYLMVFSVWLWDKIRYSSHDRRMSLPSDVN
jgi:hypothetical protein